MQEPCIFSERNGDKMSLSYKNILIAVDGSKESEKAFEKAVEISLRNDASLTITHIVESRTFPTPGGYEQITFEHSESYAQELLDVYKYRALSAGIRTATHLEYGSPKVIIAKSVAPKYNCDLIICGATGLNAVERFLIGSVSEHITRYAKCDVLVVRS